MIEWVEQHDHGEAYLKSDKSVDRGVIIGLFEQMALLDVNEANSYDTYLKSCGNLNAFTWKPNKDSSNQNRVQKHVYESNHGDISGGTYVIRVVDFEVHGSTKPNLIRMRTVNNEIEYVTVDEDKYIRVSEIYLVGSLEAQAGLDSAKSTCR